jgi:hypothetical protein
VERDIRQDVWYVETLEEIQVQDVSLDVVLQLLNRVVLALNVPQLYHHIMKKTIWMEVSTLYIHY